MAEGKGVYASLVDGVMKALAGAFIAAAGVMWKAGEEEKERLRAEIERLRKTAEVNRRRAAPAERERVRLRNRDEE